MLARTTPRLSIRHNSRATPPQPPHPASVNNSHHTQHDEYTWENAYIYLVLSKTNNSADHSLSHPSRYIDSG
jgi:hypothetical protein